MRVWLRMIVVIAAVAACGDDDAGDADAAATIDADNGPPDARGPDATPLGCGTSPGTINGTVSGQGLSPVRSAAYLENPSVPGVFGVFLDDEAVTCGDTGASGNQLAILFPCGEAQVGTYVVTSPDQFPGTPGNCPGAGLIVGVLLEDSSGSDLGTATGGEVVVTAAGACVTGTIDADFPAAETLTGSFDAERCTAN